MPSTSFDPHATEEPLYECTDCGHRDEDPDGRLCPRCGGYMQNIGVPREQ